MFAVPFAATKQRKIAKNAVEIAKNNLVKNKFINGRNLFQKLLNWMHSLWSRNVCMLLEFLQRNVNLPKLEKTLK
jgi:hypothetical protein